MRSSAPGAKFSTSTSHFLISSLSTRLPCGCFEFDRDRALVVIEHGEVERVRALHIHQLTAGDIADAGALDLDHVGAEPCQQLGTSRTRLHMGEIENADTVERLAGLAEWLFRGRRHCGFRLAVRTLPKRLRAFNRSGSGPRSQCGRGKTTCNATQQLRLCLRLCLRLRLGGALVAAGLRRRLRAGLCARLAGLAGFRAFDFAFFAIFLSISRSCPRRRASRSVFSIALGPRLRGDERTKV